MLIESTAHLPISLAIFQDVFHGPTGEALPRIILRWSHFVAGITWIGLLYFFNLVNVPFQKGLDADTKKKVNPDLLSRALWFFRWGAVFTVLAGLAYFAMYTLKGDVNNANAIGGANINLWWVLLAWLIIPDCVVRRRVSDHQKSTRVDQGWARLRDRDVCDGGDRDLGSVEVFRQYAHCRWR